MDIPSGTELTFVQHLLALQSITVNAVHVYMVHTKLHMYEYGDMIIR